MLIKTEKQRRKWGKTVQRTTDCNQGAILHYGMAVWESFTRPPDFENRLCHPQVLVDIHKCNSLHIVSQ